MYENLTREALLKLIEERDAALQIQSQQYIANSADDMLGLASFVPIYQNDSITHFKLNYHNPAFTKIIGGNKCVRSNTNDLCQLFDEDWGSVLRKAMNGKKKGLPQQVKSKHTQLTYEPSFEHVAGKIDVRFRVLTVVQEEGEQKEQLEADEERYRLIANNTNDFMYEVNMSKGAASGIAWLSGDFERVTGYTPEEVKAKRDLWEKLVHPEDRMDVMSRVAEDIERRISGTYIYRITTKHGMIRWLEDRVTIRDRAGDLRILGAVRDITREKEVKIAFNLERERYMTLFNTSRRGILIVDMINKRVVDFNPRVIELFQAPPNDIEGGNSLKFSPEYQPDGELSTQKITRYFKPHVERGETISFEWTFERPSGEQFIADVSLAPITLDKQELSVVFIDDITPRKEAEMERQLSEERFELLAENMDGVFSLLDETGLMYVTKRPKGTWEHSFADITTKRQILNVVHPSDKPAFYRALNNIFQKDANIQYRVLLPDNNLQERWIWTKTFRINQVTGKTLIAAISTDITDIKDKENELIKAKQEAVASANLKSIFIASMSHEIRTPMNGIIGFTEMLVDESIPEEEKVQFPHIINDNCQRLLGVLNDILDISKIEARQVRVNIDDVDVNTLLQEQFQLFQLRADQKGIQLQLDALLPKAYKYIRTDGPKLRQILTNLLSNAIKFTSEGVVTLSCKKKGKRLIFTVSDTGIGIPPAQQSNVFQRFQQAKGISINNYGGTGLGLSISEGLSELLEGYIFVASKEKAGTTFALNLPYVETDVEPKQEVVDLSPEKIDFKQRVILVAEDEKFNFMLLDKALSLTNAKVVHAKNGLEAIQLLEAHSEIELILMDMRMPEMDGMQATRIIKANPSYRHIPIIAQTAFGLNEDKDEVLKAGCDDYISKPINRKDLYQLLQQYLKS